ncbi:lipopolysaccharide biosynthesis protein [Butyrivibrio sp. VCB2001]|uniref:lipopolysaccharide biosynthesis protein n=1 Tax=Butyrivibrio sp. VCB2001 TaxID=1280667 RepID=UPI0003F7A6EF|nr:lipopolysaccharide biosynthesis protein [Butyrivibrio sp. VCB2001]
MKIFSNFIWRFLERAGAQGIQLIVTILLARLLEPEVFGSVAIITAVISILQVLIDGGLGNALIQQKEIDNTDCSSVFFFNIFFCTVIYLILFILSPFVAAFYGSDELTGLLRVSGIVVLISGVKNVQQAIITRELRFKCFFFSTIIGTLVSAIVGINMAVNGYGAWALVAQFVTNAMIDTLVLSITSRWRPEFVFSLSKLRRLLGYGWKLLASTLIDSVYGDFMQLVIGKVFLPNDLAFFNRGRSIPNTIVGNINTSIDSVLFPVLSKEQDNTEKVKKITQKAIIVSNYLMAPILMVMTFSAYTMIGFLLTEKWLPCVLYVRIFCIIYMMQPIHTANINALKAIGRSDLVLRIEMIKKFVGIIVFLVTLKYGMKAVIFGYLIDNFFNQIINSYPNKKLLGYGYLSQLKDIIPSVTCAALSGFVVWFFCFLPVTTGLVVILQFICGLLFYILVTSVLHITANTCFKELILAIYKERSSDKKNS